MDAQRGRLLASFERAVQVTQVEDVFGGAARADGLHHPETVQVPVAIADLDVDSRVRAVGGEQDGRVLAGTDPAVDGGGGTNGPLGGRRCGRPAVPGAFALPVVHAIGLPVRRFGARVDDLKVGGGHRRRLATPTAVGPAPG